MLSLWVWVLMIGLVLVDRMSSGMLVVCSCVMFILLEWLMVMYLLLFCLISMELLVCILMILC